MKEENEQTISGLWTEHEHYVFVALIRALKSTAKEVNSKCILELYSLIQQVTERDSINLVQQDRSTNYWKTNTTT